MSANEQNTLETSLVHFRAKHEDLATPQARADAFAKWFNCRGHQVKKDKRGEPQLTDEFLEWCAEQGASIDWVLLGDPAGMASTFREKHCPIPEVACCSDPHPEWLRQWRQARADWRQAAAADPSGDSNSTECLAAEDREYSIRAKMIETRATTQAGVNSLFAFLLEDQRDNLRGEYGEAFQAMAQWVETAGEVSAIWADSETEICGLFAKWEALTAEFKSMESRRQLGEITAEELDKLTDPILAERDKLEDTIFSAECRTAQDQAVRVKIAAYFDWAVPDFNSVVLADAERAFPWHTSAVRQAAKKWLWEQN